MEFADVRCVRGSKTLSQDWFAVRAFCASRLQIFKLLPPCCGYTTVSILANWFLTRVAMVLVILSLISSTLPINPWAIPLSVRDFISCSSSQGLYMKENDRELAELVSEDPSGLGRACRGLIGERSLEVDQSYQSATVRISERQPV